MAKKKTEQFDVYVTMDTDNSGYARVWSVKRGIRKWHGCIEYGNAESDKTCSKAGSMYLTLEACKEKYGFTPEAECAYNVYTTPSGKIKVVKVELEFSDYPDPKNGKNYTLKEIKKGCIAEIEEKKLSPKKTVKALAGIKKLKGEDLAWNALPSIIGGFSWINTDEGYSFWSNINDAPLK